MPDNINEPVPVVVPPLAAPSPAVRRRAVWLLALGGVAGLTLGVLLTAGAFAIYTAMTRTLSVPAAKDSVEVFHELNALRQEVNRLAEERKLRDQETTVAVRRAMDAVTAATAKPAAATPAAKPIGDVAMPPARRAGDPLADLDAEIERLEQTQKVLNTILDLFTPKPQEQKPKDRRDDTPPPG